MRVLRFLIEKEFRQIFRNKAMLPILFVMPLVQMLILVHAASFDVKRIPVLIRDNDATPESRELVTAVQASELLDLRGMVHHEQAGVDALRKGEATVMMVIPPDFATNREIQFVVDAVDGLTANLAVQYAMGVIGAMEPGRVTVEGRYRYNPKLDSAWYMVPGILVVLVTMVAGFLSAMNVVREREIGTIEQLNVTPITKAQFIIAKLLPFWVIAMVELGVGLAVGWMVFDVASQGSLMVVFSAAAVYLLAILGFGLLVSTLADTQQQAMLIAWFAMVVFILMSGLFTPVASMPEWAQRISDVNPVKWYIDLMRRVMLTGAGFSDVWKTFVVLAAFAVGLNAAAVARYRKVSG